MRLTIEKYGGKKQMWIINVWMDEVKNKKRNSLQCMAIFNAYSYSYSFLAGTMDFFDSLSWWIMIIIGYETNSGATNHVYFGNMRGMWIYVRGEGYVWSDRRGAWASYTCWTAPMIIIKYLFLQQINYPSCIPFDNHIASCYRSCNKLYIFLWSVWLLLLLLLFVSMRSHYGRFTWLYPPNRSFFCKTYHASCTRSRHIG